MKTFTQLFLLGLLLLGLIACRNKVVVQRAAEVVMESDTLQQACGVVIDATMNGFTMVTSRNDTLYISTMDQNIVLKGGLLLGDTLDVTYTVTEDEPAINIASTVKKVH